MVKFGVVVMDKGGLMKGEFDTAVYQAATCVRVLKGG